MPDTADSSINFDAIKDREAVIVEPGQLKAMQGGIRSAYKKWRDDVHKEYGLKGSTDPLKLHPNSELAEKLYFSFQNWLAKRDKSSKVYSRHSEISQAMGTGYKFDMPIIPKIDTPNMSPAKLARAVKALDAAQRAINDITEEPPHFFALRLEGMDAETMRQAVAAFNEFLRDEIGTDKQAIYPPYKEGPPAAPDPPNTIRAELPVGFRNKQLEELKVSLKKILSPLERMNVEYKLEIKGSKPFLGEHFELAVPNPPEGKHYSLGSPFHDFVRLLQENGNVVDKKRYDELVYIGKEGGQIFVNRKGQILTLLDGRAVPEQDDVKESFTTHQEARNDPEKWEKILSRMRDDRKRHEKPDGTIKSYNKFPPDSLPTPASPGKPKTEIVVTLSAPCETAMNNVRSALEEAGAEITAEPVAGQRQGNFR